MPKPGYIICSTTGAVDTYTNSVNAFQVIETVLIAYVDSLQDKSGMSPGPLTMRVVATWIKEESDLEGQVFDGQIVGHFPGYEEEIILGVFEKIIISTPIYRFIIPEIKINEFFGPGILRIEGRIRRVGETEWMAHQSFPILLVEGQLSRPQNAGDKEQEQVT